MLRWKGYGNGCENQLLRCPACNVPLHEDALRDGEELFEEDDTPTHIEGHDPEDFGLSPMGDLSGLDQGPMFPPVDPAADGQGVAL